MKKLVIIINGAGGVGKDTLCDLSGKYFKVKNVSSIDPVKKIAKEAGWKGEKTPEARRFLAELKRILIEYNDTPVRYLIEKYKEFIDSDEEILYCHIREPEEIEKFKGYVVTDCMTLLIKRDTGVETWGNTADDEVENFNYDCIYNNNFILKDTEKYFYELLKDKIESLKEVDFGSVKIPTYGKEEDD